MQRTQGWRFPMRRSGWNRKPFGDVWQIDDLSQFKFGVVAQARCCPGRWIEAAQDCKFAAVQLCRALTRAVSNTQYATRTTNGGASSSSTVRISAGQGLGRGVMSTGK